MKTDDMKKRLRSSIELAFDVSLEDQDFASAAVLIAGASALDSDDLDELQLALSEWEPVRRTGGNST